VILQCFQALAYLEEVEKIIDDLKEGKNPFPKFVSSVQNHHISKNAYAVFFMFKGQVGEIKNIKAVSCAF
jgi:hypothetical protein